MKCWTQMKTTSSLKKQLIIYPSNVHKIKLIKSEKTNKQTKNKNQNQTGELAGTFCNKLNTKVILTINVIR